MSEDYDDFMGGGGQSVRFDNVGDTVTGVILARPEKKAQTDTETGEVKKFASGETRYIFTVRIQTELRDPQDPADTGERTLYLKWKSLEAVRNAVRATGAPGLEPGGVLTLTLVGFGPKTKAAWNPPKLWAAQYAPPNHNDAFMGQQSTQVPQSGAMNPNVAQDAMRRLADQQARNQQRLMGTPGVGLTGQQQPTNPPF